LSIKQDQVDVAIIKRKMEQYNVPPTRRACSYTVWPYSPAEWRNRRFGVLDAIALRWIKVNCGSKDDDRSLFFAKMATEELQLRKEMKDGFVGASAPIRFGPARKIRLPVYKDEVQWIQPDDPINPSDLMVDTVEVNEDEPLTPQLLRQIADLTKERERLLRERLLADRPDKRKTKPPKRPPKHGIEL